MMHWDFWNYHLVRKVERPRMATTTRSEPHDKAIAQVKWMNRNWPRIQASFSTIESDQSDPLP